MRTMRRGPVALALLVVIAACNGGSGRAAPSTTEPPITLPPSATSSSTVATTTGSAGATTVSTTTAAPTTVDPKAAAEAEVRKAVDLAQSTYSACAVALPHCDPQSLAVADEGAQLERLIEQVTEYNKQGYAVRNRESFRYTVESVQFSNETLSEAVAIVCSADTTVIYRPGAGPGGADVIVNDDFLSARETWSLRRGPAAWHVYEIALLGAEERTRDLCVHA